MGNQIIIHLKRFEFDFLTFQNKKLNDYLKFPLDYKKVKGQTGFAPVDLIKEFRLSHAAELLQTTNLNITEVAYRSGFKDASYFGKCFRKRYGMSPREYIHQQ